MPDLAQILDAQHEIFVKNERHWAAEERRLHGGYPMLVELERFTNETEASYTSRQRQSPLLNFGRIHGSIIIGHLNEVAPMPNFGTLGQVRERKAIPRGSETNAERFAFNANGVGTNGIPFIALSSGIQLRSLATGFRWTLVEMPRRPNGKPEDAPITGDDIKNGHRPFIVEYSPRSVPMWDIQDGRLNWAVIRTDWRKAGLWEPSTGRKGYYLLVRQGYDGLGDQFAGGGWWLYDPDKRLESNGSWARTKGEIPLAQYGVDESNGTDEDPAVATMPLMELNQLSSGLMNRISERNWNARQAAKSQKHILGAEPQSFNEAVELTIEGSYYIPWQPFVPRDKDGRIIDGSKVLVPTLYDGANGAVESSVYAEIIRSTIEEAHEIMVRQLTSTPDSTGRSKEAGFNEATSPLLSSLATRRESWENTVIPWVEMRAGAEQPSGFVEWPQEFDLTPIIQKIDMAIDRMLKMGARSPTLEASMLEKASTDQGVWPTKESEATAARDELLRSLSAVKPDQAQTAAQLASVGYTSEGIADAIGLEQETADLLVGGPVTGSADAALPESAAVTGEQDVGGTLPDSGQVGGTPTATPPRTPDNLPPGSDSPPPTSGTEIGSRNRNQPPEQNRPEIASPPREAPAVDLSPVTERLDALTAQISALVTAIGQKQAPTPEPAAPVIVPITMPVSTPTQSKSVSVTTPDNRTFTVQVTPSTNGTTPNTP